jgi:pimeloyl-ACP methyl ester carboxylesterase
VFRGTQPDKLEDLLADANVKRVSAQDAQVARDAKDGKGAKSSIAALAVPGRMHAGFAAALGLVVAKLDAAAPKLAGCTLHVAGHSLGGALATLAAIHLSRRHSCPIGSVYTFGSPRVGDGVFAREFELRLGTRCHRVVNNEDLVTRVPTRTMGYEHVGRIAYIDGDGCVSHDIGQWFRVLSFVTNALGDFKETVKTTVRDHSMKLYVGHLERAAKRP